MAIMLIGATALAKKMHLQKKEEDTERIIAISASITSVVTDSCHRMLDAKTLHLKYSGDENVVVTETNQALP